MTHPGALALNYAVGSDAGLHRELNEDSAYASSRVLAVADGMGGHAHGEVASSVAVAAISDLDEQLAAGSAEVDLVGALAGAVQEVARRLDEMVARDPELKGAGTTLTALLWDDGGRFGLAHIGDSRAYLVRGGELHQITRDHTWVQTLVEEGRVSPEEAEEHPRKSMLLRALQAGGAAAGEPDLSVLDAQHADRYLLCSDGVTAVLSADDLRTVLTTMPEPEAAVRRIIELANQGGSPDNVTCIVADVVPSGAISSGAISSGAIPSDNGASDNGASDPEAIAPTAPQPAQPPRPGPEAIAPTAPQPAQPPRPAAPAQSDAADADDGGARRPGWLRRLFGGKGKV